MQFVSRKPWRPWQEILFGLIFAAAGIGLLLFSVSTIQNYNQKNETYIETTSVVVDYDYDSEGLAAIIVEYTVDGEVYRKQSNSYSNMPISMGTEVEIKYNPDYPRDAIWANDSTNIVLPLIGGVFALAGIIIVVSGIKKMKNKKDDPTIQQLNGPYNSVDGVNPLQNNLGLGQQPVIQPQQPVIQPQQPVVQPQQPVVQPQQPVVQPQQPVVQPQQPVVQPQQPVANQIQDAFPQNSNYPNEQSK